MAIKCLHCGAANNPDAKACEQCGKSIVRGATEIERTPEGFRRGTVVEQDKPQVSEEEPRFAGGKTMGNYVIEREIASGGMSTVYLARHRDLEVLVALKALHPALTADRDFRQRFLREARIQSQLYHPNIAQVRDYIEHEGHFYLVMEYLEGGTLAEVLTKQHNAIQPVKALEYVSQALAGLDCAHGKDVVHRDIKPTNIMLDRFGRAKIMDFGIAVATGQKRLTSTGVTIGTAQYMSPEQIRTPLKVDRRTDIYSMGVVLFELLTGAVPFEADSDFEIQRAHVQDTPRRPSTLRSGIDESLDKIVLKALEKRPEDRYQHCTEFSRAVESWGRIVINVPRAEPSAEPAKPSPPQPPPPQPPQPPAPSGTREDTALEKGSLVAMGVCLLCFVLALIAEFLKTPARWLDLPGLWTILTKISEFLLIAGVAGMFIGLAGFGLNAIINRQGKTSR